MTGSGRGPFEGLQVLEFAAGFSGPLMGMMFADYGADVVKIEPPEGDWARGLRGFRMWNRGKRSVVADLEDPGERALVEGVIQRSDVIITNYRPGVPERLGIGWHQVAALNPRSVYCSISGFGALEGFSRVKAYEALVSAKAGKMVGLDTLSGAGRREVGDRPLYSAAPVASYAAGQLGFQGAVAALLDRDVTGRGQLVETSLLQGLMAATMRLPFRRVGGDDAERTRAKARRSLQYRGIELTFLTVQCGDGKWIQMCARQDHHFRNWMKALGLHQILDDPRFADAPLGFKCAEDLEEVEGLIRTRMRQRTQKEWMDDFIVDDVGADPFLTFDEFLASPQMTLNERIVHLKDGEVGMTTQVGPLAWLADDYPPVSVGAPPLGRDTVDMVENAMAPPSTTIGQAEEPGQRAPVHRRTSTDHGPRSAPLSGVTVVELAYFLAGPLGSTLLAEMGARVIKVEPLAGDPFRRVGVEFAQLQHGKESIAIDLKSPAGKEVLLRIVKEADIFLHNLRPGAIARLGCDYQSMRAVNPTLVYLNASSYGSRGPEAERAGFHSTPNALSGSGILQAGRGNPPVDDSYPDPCAGIAVASAMLIGLAARRRSGEGQYVETAMIATAGFVHSNNLVQYEGAPPRLAVNGDQDGLHALYRLYPCRAGWVFLAVMTEAEWGRLCHALGHGEWIEDPRFDGRAARLASDTELSQLIAEALEARSADHWEAVLEAADVGAVRADEWSLEQFLVQHGVVREESHPRLGEYWRLPSRVTFNGAEGRYGKATVLGESTVAVLEELGYQEAEIKTLCDGRVVLDDRRGPG